MLQYANNGETIGSNLVLLCPRHRGAIHNRGWTITGNPNNENGGVVFHRLDGRAAPPPADSVGDPTGVAAINEASGIEPKPDTTIPRGRGERYDHEMTIWITTNYFRANPPEQ